MEPPVLSIIIPTYLEASNLVVLLPELCFILDKAGLSFEIVIVDDNSPDMTPQVCDPYVVNGRVRLIRRLHERGLATAVLHGLYQARGRVVVVMDADLSHPPDVIPEMVKTLEQQGVEMVIGSRYVPAGSAGVRWTWHRRLNSSIGTLLARPLTRVKDPLAGFFAIHRDRVLRVRHLEPMGYKIALELLVKCSCRRVVEIPIHFRNRRYGQSKLDLKVQWAYLRHLVHLYVYRLQEWCQTRRPVAS